ncbi:MAG TPA: sugar phosphate isomerase/epimerase [Pirellulaceae bacterium]|nr:sugar phosphate isomerase/epimerase [Pirellulaceae bacterium]
MKLGIDSYSTRNSGLDPPGILNLASDLGLQGVLFELSPFDSFRGDDLDRIRKTAEDKGLYIEFGMGSILGWHPMAAKGRELLADAGYDVSVSDAEILIDHLQIADSLGSPLLRCVAGDLFTRDEGRDMADLAEDVVSILKEACPVARDMGMKIAIENHADFTVRELLAILARVDSPALGLTVDCANLAFDLDEPMRLAKLMAPYALTTHYKNYRIIRTRNGLALENGPVGEGDIDVVSIARTLAEHDPRININIEIHSQFSPFTLNIFDEEFFEKHPSPPGDGLAWYLERSWSKDILETLPPNLPDGERSWDVERADLKRSASWAKEELTPLLSE